jgi:hypothetical protein
MEFAQAKLAVEQAIKTKSDLTGLAVKISQKQKSRLVSKKMEELRRKNHEEIMRIQRENNLRMRIQHEENLRIQQEEKQRLEIISWEQRRIFGQFKALRVFKGKQGSMTHQDQIEYILSIMAYNCNFKSWERNQRITEQWEIGMSWFCLNVVETRLQVDVLEMLELVRRTDDKIMKKQSIFTAPEDRREISESLHYLEVILLPFIKSQFERFKTLSKKGDLATANVWFHPFASGKFDLEPVIRLVNSFVGGERMIGRISRKSK